MIIQHNMPALNAHRNLATNNDAISKSLEKLSSGYKINRAADDAAGLAISEKMRSQIRGFDRAAENALDGVSLIQTAEGALDTTAKILQRMKTMAIQASNGVYAKTTDLANAQEEFSQLRLEINDIALNTKFNGQKLLDGSLSSDGTTPGDTGIVLQTGNTSAETIIININAMSVGTGGLKLSLTQGVGVSAQTHARNTTIAAIEDAINTVSKQRAVIGAQQNRLEYKIDNLRISSENLTSAESRIRDVDMAKEMMIFSKNNILSQAAQSMLAQANSLPQGVLQLLR